MCFSASEHKLSDKSSCEFTRKERRKKKKNPQAINNHTIKKKKKANLRFFIYSEKKKSSFIVLERITSLINPFEIRSVVWGQGATACTISHFKIRPKEKPSRHKWCSISQRKTERESRAVNNSITPELFKLPHSISASELMAAVFLWQQFVTRGVR